MCPETFYIHISANKSFALQIVICCSFIPFLYSTSFTHCPFYLLWCDTNAPRRWLNLHKTNAANEVLVSRLFYGREAQGGFCYTDCSYHSNSLSNKMDNSLLAVRDINHKYSVVGGFFILLSMIFHIENVFLSRRGS